MPGRTGDAAVSNPNNKPPNAATTVLFNKVEFSFMAPVRMLE